MSHRQQAELEDRDQEQAACTLEQTLHLQLNFYFVTLKFFVMLFSLIFIC
jgi:hypothetical protein